MTIKLEELIKLLEEKNLILKNLINFIKMHTHLFEDPHVQTEIANKIEELENNINRLMKIIDSHREVAEKEKNSTKIVRKIMMSRFNNI